MLTETHKKISFCIIGIYFFLGGVEYAVILPTAWEYLRSQFNSEPYKFGLLLSSFCLSGILAGPIMGICADKMQNAKYLLLFANLWEIGGSLLYFLARSDWTLILSRLLAGVGTGVGAALFADVSRVTETEKLTGVMSMLMACRQIGTVAGPGFNLILRELDFQFHDFVLNKFNAPGAFMAVLWIILQVIIIFLYTDLRRLKENLEYSSINGEVCHQFPRSSEVPTHSYTHPNSEIENVNPEDGSQSSRSDSSITSSSENLDELVQNVDNIFTTSNDLIEGAEHWMSSASTDAKRFVTHQLPTMIESEETYRQISPRNDERNIDSSYSSNELYPNGGLIDINNDDTRVKFSSFSKNSYFCREFIREEVIVLLMASFVAILDQATLETIITPLTYNLLQWSDFENSILFSLCGFEILIVLIGVKFISKKLSDRQLLVYSFILDSIVNIIMLTYIPTAKPHNYSLNFAVLISGIVLNLVAIPIIVVASVSLYSKITSEEHQGGAQGVRRAFAGFGSLLGPLWAGGLLSQNNQNSTKCYILIGVLVFFMILSLVMILISYSKLKEPDKEKNNAKNKQEDQITSERTPLLRT